VKLAALAVMFDVPYATPVTCGCVEGVVCPAEMDTDAGEIVTADGFELNSETVTPPAGAATESVTGKATD
jgi:hypothetical protein